MNTWEAVATTLDRVGRLRPRRRAAARWLTVTISQHFVMFTPYTLVTFEALLLFVFQFFLIEDPEGNIMRSLRWRIVINGNYLSIPSNPIRTQTARPGRDHPRRSGGPVPSP